MNANTKIVQDCYAAFGRGDVPFIQGQCTENVDWNGSDSPEISYRGRFQGRNEMVQFFVRLAGALDVKAFEPKTYLADGNEVMTTGTWTCSARNTGKTFTAAWAMRFVFDNGRIAWFRAYPDTAVEAAALRK
jgi:uncharacterized protein